MAGGQSSRMGTDKGLVELNNQAMASFGIELLSSFFEKVLISTNNPDYTQFNRKLVNDKHKNIGPIGGLEAVMRAVSTKYIFALSCDMPYMEKNIVDKLLSDYSAFDVTIARVADRIQPLCAIYSTELLSEIQDRIANKNYKLYDLILSSYYNLVNFENEKAFININSSEDLNRVQK